MNTYGTQKAKFERKSFHLCKLSPDDNFLPRFCKCASLHCLIYHYGQPSNNLALICIKCWEVNHSTNDYPNQPRCNAICKKKGMKLVTNLLCHFPKLPLLRSFRHPFKPLSLRAQDFWSYPQIIRACFSIFESSSKLGYPER